MAKELTPEAVEEIKERIYDMLDVVGEGEYNPHDLMMAVSEIAYNFALTRYEEELDRIPDLNVAEGLKKDKNS